ncbi:MAG: fumarylacetoacetate hydrolase family protein [Anaerolineales bacterium]|nr:fumarylacetoacetate hydrolase family protein [Anaerolineales bacterium]
MKLITYTQTDETRLGAVLGEQVIDLAAASSNAGAAWASGKLNDMRTCLDHWDQTRPLIADLLHRADTNQLNSQSIIPIEEVKIEAPLPNPGKIVCVGLNYADHCREQGLETPERPLLFAKFPSSVIGPEEAIFWSPEASSQVDYEAELGVVIGRRARRVPAEEALKYVAGYTNVNDISARDVQFSDGQWIRGKSFDTFCPLGPYMVTADEIQNPQELPIRCTVNSRVLQDSSTAEMIFPVAEIIAYITRTSTLNPGDVICTGTPAGVGVFRDPKVFLHPGDVVEVEIGQLGALRNPVGNPPAAGG